MQQKNTVVGYIYGDVGSTEFNFAVDGQNIQKFDYILAPHKEGNMLAQIMDIKQHSDLSFDNAASIMKSGGTPSFSAKLTALAGVIGYRDKDGILQIPRTPFSAGTAIMRAEESLIRHVLGLNASEEDGAYIGLLKGHNIRVYLNIDSLVQKHICILAKTGGGKSYACGVLIEELLKHKIPMVVIDTHGEYHSLTEPNKSKKDLKNMEKFGIKRRSYEDQVNEYSPINYGGKIKHLTLNGLNLEAREIIELLSAKLSGPQIGVLYQAIKEIKEYKKIYNLRDIIDAVSRSKSNARWNVIASLESLDSIGVFSEEGTPTSDLVVKGKCTTINMKGVPPDVQDVVVARLTKELFNDRKAGKIPPFLFIVEEAHNYCPERGFGTAVSSNILRTVASEGRKFGMGLCVVSQRPAKVDKNIISQCNTNIILKVTNPNDLKAIIQSVEGLTNATYDEIQRLPIGVALISGAGLQMPLMAEIRTRETNHGGKSVGISKPGAGDDDVYEAPKEITNPVPQRMLQPLQKTPTVEKPKTTKETTSLTEKAKNVGRVAKRLGWVSTDDPDEAIKILTKEAEKMKENVYKYLESLAKLAMDFCFEQNPNCKICPMNQGCKYYITNTAKQKRGFFRR
ncbi:MAG: helicase HerA domain-containing protein [Thermoplasmatota archaeon]